MKNMIAAAALGLAFVAGASTVASTAQAGDLPFQNGIIRQPKVFTDPNIIREDHTQDPRQAHLSFPAGTHYELPDLSLHAALTASTCTTPKVANDCCGYNIGGTQYHGPKEVYKNEADSRSFAGGLTPRMAFFLPFEGDIASLGQGWIYENGNEHSSADFSKTKVDADTDPTFAVRAAAPGRVVSKVWDNWHGNILVLEHTAGNGTKYRTLYFHLRNGKRNDLANARAIKEPTPANDTISRYIKYAALKDPKDINWGTDSQKIPVNVGDWVEAGQFIAWSGNTGPGGAGAGLNADGTLMDTTRANNHLHFMLAVVNPKTTGEWIFIDAFGVYAKVSTGCYDVMKNNDYKRFFAPFYSNFHNVPSDLVGKYFSYYPDMGMTLQTHSLYLTGGKLMAAGSFQPQAPNPFYSYGFQTSSDFNTTFAGRFRDGYRPHQLQVTLDASGQPRFTSLWKKRGGEGVYTYINMPQEDLDAKWQDLVVRQGFRIEDFAAYTVGGQRRFAAIFVKDGLAFSFFHGMNQQAFDAKWQEMNRLGFANTAVTLAQLPEGERFGGVWTKTGGAWATYINMNSAGYQRKFEELSRQGYRLHKVQGLPGGSRFNAIWRK